MDRQDLLQMFAQSEAFGWLENVLGRCGDVVISNPAGGRGFTVSHSGTIHGEGETLADAIGAADVDLLDAIKYPRK